VTIHLENGKSFTFLAKNKKKDQFYVSSTSLNGQSYKKHYLNHSELIKGGQFEFNLSGKPNLNKIDDTNLPETKISEQLITPVPFFSVSSFKFKDQLSVSIGSPIPEATYYFQINKGPYQIYLKPFVIDTSCLISTYSVINGISSFTVNQQFYKVPSDKTITILSKVHPMYTAGGADALIDGIKGNSNWKAGEWQSYFDQDFEAVIDLKQVRELHYLGIDVLQDVSPWIVFPKEVQFFSSDDGIHYSLAGQVKNTIPVEQKESQTQELGLPISIRTRYIKVKALSGGPLPEWHESKGNPTHLFIDEIVIN
jgi:hypothetical protein